MNFDIVVQDKHRAMRLEVSQGH